MRAPGGPPVSHGRAPRRHHGVRRWRLLPLVEEAIEVASVEQHAPAGC
jgi:hypothetical protein